MDFINPIQPIWNKSSTFSLLLENLLRENYIIKLRFFEGKTQMEVAEEIHISQAQVSRLEKSALKNMKNYLSLTPTYRRES